MDLYRENILDHYKHPRNFGHIDNAHVVSDEVNMSCGDRIRIEIAVDNEKISLIRFTGEGCAIHQASASMLTEKVTGMNIADVLALSRSDIEELLGTTLTPSRVKCAVLPLEAIHKALINVR